MTDSVWVVGAGRVGSALAAAWRRVGVPVAGLWSRSESGAARAAALVGLPCAHGEYPRSLSSARVVVVATPDPATGLAAKSYAGFAGYTGGVPIDWALMGGFTAVTVIGSSVGAHFSTRISHETLKKAFAWFLAVVATYILFKSVIGG